MERKLLIILFALMMSVVLVNALSPNRCLFQPGIRCIDFEVNPKSSQVILNFSNDFGEKASFSFNARYFLTGDPRKGALSCLCNGLESCILEADANGRVICTFDQGVIPPDENTKFGLVATMTFPDKTREPLELGGTIYKSVHDNEGSTSVSTGSLISGVAILIAYSLLIFFVGKNKKLKDWLRSSLKSYLITSLVVFILCNFFVFWSMGYMGYADIFYTLYSLGIALILVLPIGLIWGLVLYLISKNKAKKTKNNNK
jgi:hypothetical protein